MQGRMEVEEILEQRSWADRNGLEPGAITYLTEEEVRVLHRQRGAYLPPARMLRDHELRTYRDCPRADAYDVLPTVPLGWLLIGWVSVLMFLGAGVYLWVH